MSSGWGRDTLRCNGIPKHHNAAPISPSYARPASTARGRGPARKWATASNTQLPKGAWKRCPPPRPPATAESILLGQFGNRFECLEEHGSNVVIASATHWLLLQENALHTDTQEQSCDHICANPRIIR